jgi:hypothetical protein
MVPLFKQLFGSIMKRIDNQDKSVYSFWYPLDNAAKIFPAITTSELTSVFRISARLKKKVNIKLLFKAVRTVESRFPYYKVIMRKGFFWYYLESAQFSAPVVSDLDIPCRRFNRKQNLFRIVVAHNRIGVEFSHELTDGTGAFEFLKTLLVSYFQYSGFEIPSSYRAIRVDQKPDPEEFEDAYLRYFKEETPKILPKPKAFHLPFPLRQVPRFTILNLIVSTSSVKEKADEKKVSITVYLVSVYLHVIQEIYENVKPSSSFGKQKKLCIEVPVNLRKIYKSATMRNFSLYVMPEIDLRLGRYSFDEILKMVYHQMQLETDEKLVAKTIARNVGGERKFLVRSIPLFLKSFLMRRFYYSLGCDQFSGVLTNLGGVTLPGELGQQIDYLVFTPPPPNKMNKANIGVIGYGDKLVLSFGNISATKELEKRFVHFFNEQGISVKLSN